MGSNRKYQMDMCHGSLWSQIFRFSLPLMGTNIMTLMFHAADLIVLGQFAPDSVRVAATAAVGATTALHTLLLIFFSGFSAGVNSVTARYIGAKDYVNVSRTVHTSVALGVYGGVVFTLIGVLFSRTALQLMGTPPDVLDKATIYLQIYSIGLPFTVLYLIGSAILRAVGDTRRPLIFIIFAGVVNVLLNLFFVVVCKMDAAGVALATKIASVISAWLVIRALRQAEGPVKLVFKKIRFHASNLKEVLWIGVPAGIQGALYTVSNIFIQSSVNSLGSAAMAGNAACQSLEGMASIASGSFYQTSMSFAGQNLGGKKYKRVVKSIWVCLFYTTVFSLLAGGIFLAGGRMFLSFYNPDPTVISWGMERLVIMMSCYALCGIMDTISGSLRGLGHSVKPTITTIMGACGLRIFWVLAIFPHYKTLRCLMISYPVSWIVTGLVNGIILYFVCRQMLMKASRERNGFLTLR